MKRVRELLLRPPRGFTLIEVLIAVVVLSIAVGTLLTIVANLTAQTLLPEFLNTAGHLAEQEMERVTGLRFSQVVNEGPASYGGNFSDYSYQVVISPVPAALAADPGMADYKQVQVIVTHSTAGAVDVRTIVTNT